MTAVERGREDLTTEAPRTPYGEWYDNAVTHLRHLSRFQRWVWRVLLGIEEN